MANTAFRFLDHSGLLNNGVDDFMMKDNELTECKNCYSDKIGRLIKTPGYSLSYNGQVINAKNVNFLHYYYDPAASVGYMLAGSDSGSDYILKTRTTGAWSSTIGTYSSGAGAEMSAVNYLGKAFIVGYKTGTFLSPATLEATTYTTSSVTDSDLLNMPSGKYIARYRDLIYVANARVSSVNYPNRIYFCNEPISMAITWTVATEFIDVGYDDGDEITGVLEAYDRLIIFKRNSIWKYDEAELVKIDDVGCDSYKSIAKVNGTLYWFNRYGFWRWNGGLPELISAKIQDYIEAKSESTLSSVVASVYRGFEYRAFLGTLTVNGTTYANSWFCWDTRTENCYIRCTYDSAYSACEYIESSSKRMYFGNNNGYVMKFANKVDSVYGDNGHEIDSFFSTRFIDNGVPEYKKQATKITIFMENPQGMKIFTSNSDGDFTGRDYQTQNSPVKEIETIIDQKRYKYKFAENGLNKSWIFNGFIIESDLIEE